MSSKLPSLSIELSDIKSQHSIYSIIQGLDYIVKNQLILVLLPILPQSIHTSTFIDTNETLNPMIENNSKYIVDVTNLYKDITYVLQYGFLAQSSLSPLSYNSSQSNDRFIDINDVNIIRFLKVTLPSLIEAILKRKTLRYYLMHLFNYIIDL